MTRSADPSPDVDAIVGDVVTRVATRFPNAHLGDVAALARAELRSLSSAPVQNFVEILIERKVNDCLRASALTH